jgi:uncharacterized protein YndB with AHSA1/START domain
MPDIEHLIRIDAPVARILPLVTTAEGFRQWWAEDTVEDAHGGVRLGFFDRATIYALKPDGHVPPIVTWRCDTGKEWTGTRVRFELSASGGATVVRFTHADWQDATEYFRSCNTTWGALAFRLKAVAEGRSPGPLFLRSALAY